MPDDWHRDFLKTHSLGLKADWCGDLKKRAPRLGCWPRTVTCRRDQTEAPLIAIDFASFSAAPKNVSVRIHLTKECRK